MLPLSPQSAVTHLLFLNSYLILTVIWTDSVNLFDFLILILFSVYKHTAMKANSEAKINSRRREIHTVNEIPRIVF